MVNMYSILLLGGLLVAAGLIAAIIGALTLMNYLRRRRGVQASLREHYRKTHHADGTPLPPHGMGVCRQCQKVGFDIYYLPPDRRLCPECYHKAEGYKHEEAVDARREVAVEGKRRRNRETGPTIHKKR